MKKNRLWFLGMCVLLIMSIAISGCSGTENGKGEDANNTPPVSAEGDEKDNNDSQGSENEKDNDDSQGSGDEVEETGYTLPLVDEPLTLTYMRDDTQIPGCSFADGKAIAVTEAERITGVKIQWELSPSEEYEEKLQIRLASRQNLPDIIRLKGGQEGTYLTKALADGVVIPLNDYIEKYGVYYKKILDENPLVREAVTLPDGSIISFHKIEETRYAYAAQLIRQDWLDALDLEMPTSLEELLEVAKEFKERIPDELGIDEVYGMHCANPSGNMFEYNQLGSAFGLHLCTGQGWAVRDGKVVYEFVTPEAREFLRYLKKVVDSGVLPPDYSSVTYPDHDARVASGKVGLIPRNWPGNIIEWNNPDSAMRQNQPDARWTITPALTAEGSSYTGDPIFVKEPTVRRYVSVAISSACEHPDIAFKFLDWATYSDEGALLNAYGLEGESYVMKDGKPVQIPSGLTSAERVMPDGRWSGSEYVERYFKRDFEEADFELGNIDPEGPIVKAIQANWPYLKEPFYPPIPTVEDGKRISQLLADIKTYKDESWAKFCNGTLSIDDDWDDYVKTMEQMGLNEVLDIYQEGYDRLSN